MSNNEKAKQQLMSSMRASKQGAKDQPASNKKAAPKAKVSKKAVTKKKVATVKKTAPIKKVSQENKGSKPVNAYQYGRRVWPD